MKKYRTPITMAAFVLAILSAAYGSRLDLTHGWGKDPADGQCKYKPFSGRYTCSPNDTGPVCTVLFGTKPVGAYNNATNCQAQTATGLLRRNAL